MEWLGVLLLYLISGFMKKRQQNIKRREIESDPEWDSEKISSKNIEESPSSLDQLLNDLFEDNPKTLEPTPLIRQEVRNVNAEPSFEHEEHEVYDPSLVENKEDSEEKTLQSNLSERDEQHLGNKWQKKANIRRNLFKSQQDIKKSIIIKEVLDQPLALRK